MDIFYKKYTKLKEGKKMIGKDDIYYPMLVFTNYNNEHEKLLKKLKNDLKKSQSTHERDKILIKCKEEIDKWHRNLIIKCILIFFVTLFILICIKFWLNSTVLFGSVLILIYIVCFSLDKFQNKYNIKNEIEKYASDIRFITKEDIYIR